MKLAVQPLVPSSTPGPLQICTVEHECHRPVVHKFNHHVGAKHAPLAADAESLDCPTKLAVQFIRKPRLRGAGE